MPRKSLELTDALELLRLGPVALVVLSRAGRVTDFNPELERLLQREGEPLGGSVFTQYLSAQSAPEFLTHLWNSFQHPNVTQSSPLQVLRVDGSTKVVVMKSLITQSQECASLLVEARDVACELGSELFARIDLGLVWLDLNGRILDNNMAFSGLFEFTADQLTQRPVRSLFLDWPADFGPGSTIRSKPVRLQGLSRDGQTIPIEGQLFQTRGDLEGVVDLFVARDLRAQEVLERRSLRIADLERRAIGRELHDALGQNLVGMAFLADELAAQLGETPPRVETAEQLGARALRIAKLCRDTNSIAMDLVRGLVPIGLEKGSGGLSAALRSLASSCSATYGIKCQAHCQPCDVATETAEQLFRVAQEALTNAVKHSGCTEIMLQLTVNEDRIGLTVTDNGKGIDPTETQNFGTGLHSMRHRCALIGAILAVRSIPEGGTSLAVSLLLCGRPSELS